MKTSISGPIAKTLSCTLLSYVYLVSGKENIMLSSDMSDGYFCFHDEPQVFTKMRLIEDIFSYSDKNLKRDVKFMNGIFENGVSYSISAAVIPFEQRGRIHSALYMEKKKEHFSEDEKRGVRAIAAFTSAFFDTIPEVRKKSVDIRKDNTFNNVIMSRLMHKINTEKFI